MYLFPAIDIIGGQVVRLLKGDYGQRTTYGSDPLSQAKRFADAGATYLHVVDLDGARTGEPVNLPIIERICRETGLTVEVGGGVRDEQTIDRLLEAGVQRIVLGTAALTDWPWFERLAHQSHLADRLVLGLDARKGKLAIGGWERTIETTALEIAERVAGWPLAGIVFTDIATDGTLEGPNLESTRRIAEATDVPVVASGGVGTLEHLRALRELPIFGAIVGRALYEQRFTVGEALAAFEI
jgi:phosphoribosylformimino-5-aminoimidazole carboxamide ribotide isomerase